MAWRFDKMVIRGEIDNTVRGSVTGTIWLLGREQPMTLDLDGDAWPDLAGCKLTFENPNPIPQPQYDEGLSMSQTGSVGDITASQKLKKLLVPEEVWMKALEERRFHEVPWVLSNSLYLEWFSDRNGRVVIQTTDYVLNVSERQWELDEDEQAAQQAINEENMRAFMEDAARALGGEDLAAEAEDEEDEGQKPQ
jgi:hypothetical protein